MASIKHDGVPQVFFLASIEQSQARAFPEDRFRAGERHDWPNVVEERQPRSVGHVVGGLRTGNDVRWAQGG
jgi:hypothetical protein